MVRGAFALVTLAFVSENAWAQSAENQIDSSSGANINTHVGANRFYNAGITGQSTITANVEAGHIWGTASGHETLTHVTQFSQRVPGIGLYDRHATWVGSHIGGRNGGTVQGNRQLGIAHGTDLRSGAIATQWNGTAYATSFSFSFSTLVPYEAYFGVADVINSSWGGTNPTGDNAITTTLDGLANQNPGTTFVASAGNSGSAANSVVYPGSGYNAITAAALASGGAGSYDTIASFSSRGPQDYADPTNGTISGVRAAVDIAAPGTHLTAAFYGGQTGGNNTSLPGSAASGGPDWYTTGLQGTSFAAPITAGGAALIDSASYNDESLSSNSASRDARVVKAVLLNSADKIPGWGNGQVAHTNGFGGVSTTQSLDWASGAGALNLDQAFDQYFSGTQDVPGTSSGLLGSVATTGWDFGNVLSGVVNVYEIAESLLGDSLLTVTLDWFRERTFDVFPDVAQANLELRIRDTMTGNLISESSSMYNVVEHLHFTLPSTSQYQIEVAMNGTTFGSLSDEEYGLAWWGVAAASVPEPGSFALACIALAFLGVAQKRRRDRATTNAC